MIKDDILANIKYFQREGLRRSPRKNLMNINVGEALATVNNQENKAAPAATVTSAESVPSPTGFNVKNIAELPKRLNFSLTPNKQTLSSNNMTPVRCSPRKSLNR